MKRSFVAVAVLAVAGLMPAPSRAATVQIFMTNFRFCTTPVCPDPTTPSGNADITISRGSIVQWIFADPACVPLNAVGCYHTATTTTAPQAFHSGAMPGPAGSFGLPNPKVLFERTFTVAGTYNYVCTVHAGAAFPLGPMRAQIRVT